MGIEGRRNYPQTLLTPLLDRSAHHGLVPEVHSVKVPQRDHRIARRGSFSIQSARDLRSFPHGLHRDAARNVSTTLVIMRDACAIVYNTPTTSPRTTRLPPWRPHPRPGRWPTAPPQPRPESFPPLQTSPKDARCTLRIAPQAKLLPPA